MTDEERLAVLGAAHPGWRLWRARTASAEPGMWMATRSRALTTEEMYAGLACTLAEDSADLLRDVLREQRRIEAPRAREVT
ncbi:MAG: hypothetical protein JWO67_1253 [Streptosporangiaceae bacterium]|jgi:hypothetical protein|nr:hypothetical protein [Streptosporangiaceae bacterium]